MQNLFVLLKNLDDDELQKVLSKNDLYKKVTIDDLKNLPHINQDNVVNICNFVDYYQLIDDLEFIEDIRFHILNNNEKVINALNQIPKRLYQQIYDHECISLSNQKIKCYLYINYQRREFEDHHIQHISCYRYFTTKNERFRYGLIEMCEVGSLDLIKYLYKYKIGPNYDKHILKYSLQGAVNYGHAEVVKYLFEELHLDNDTKCDINNAVVRGHIDVIKYLVEVQQYTVDCLYMREACENGYFDTVKYLVELLNFQDIILLKNIAIKNGRKNIAEYLKTKIKN